MSEADLYMPDTNQSFDLPRWQTQVDPLSSTAQAAHAAQNTYHYSAPPPPPQSIPAASPQRLQQIHQTPTGPTRHRISQLIDDQQPPGSSQYLSSGHGQLTRSASLTGGHSGNTPSSRARRHHQPEDLEGPFNIDSSSRQSGQLLQTPFYPPSAPYQQQSLTGPSSLATSTSSTTEAFSDMYYNGQSAQAAKRMQPIQDVTSSARATRSPLRGPASSGQGMDSYTQQAQYSPTAVPYSYGANATTDQRSNPPYHNRNHSQVKTTSDAMTPPPFTPQAASAAYSASYAMDTSSPHPSTQAQAHLNAPHSAVRGNSSNPSTPLSYLHTQSPVSQYYSHDQPMVVDPPPRRRASGFRRVRTVHDLQPRLDAPTTGRRMGGDGVFLSPLRQLTTNILDTYRICNSLFRYESTHNPRRVLTKPSKPAHNEGYDNDDYDYILYVNDWLGTEEGHKYLILDILGQGTFGQVVKCQNMKTHEIVAVKVVKNKPAYFNQSMMEVTILEMLNKTCDPNDEHHILRLRDSFIHRNHLCLVFELLSSNLYELIKQNQFQGLSTQLVKVFMAQLLDALTVLKEARLIHCDLKPENILLRSLQSPQIKVIDFGSACHERQTVYTYIQSRFYRSPEVLLGMSYTASIDMWSLGCIAVELFLGLPLFPGTSEYNQLSRIIDMLGLPPLSMLNTGKQAAQFFDSYEVWNPQINQNEKKYRLKSIDQYSREHGTNEQPGKQYFKATALPEIINTAPMPPSKSRSNHEVEKELNNRASFIDFCQGLLNLNPVTRWTPQQARLHPFITGEKWAKPFVPDGITQPQSAPTNVADPKRPYGGLVPSQPKGTRAYQDAATYNHHLAQHQAYTAHAQAQATNTFPRNPYVNPQGAQQQQPRQQQAPPSQQQAPPPPPPQQQQSSAGAYPMIPDQVYSQQQYSSNQNASSQHRLMHQASTGQLAGANAGNTAYNPPAQQQHQAGGRLANMPPTSVYSISRARANTINQMKEVPPALARLHRIDNIPRDALTPVLNRDDAMQEWERRQSGKASAPSQSYPQIEYLQQQAEMAASSGSMNWAPPQGNRYAAPPSKLSHSYHPQTIMVDDETGRRDVVMSNVRATAGRTDTSNIYGGSSGSGAISNPPQAYASNATTSGNRYANTYGQPQQSQSQGPPGGGVAFDGLDRRPPQDLGNLYSTIQPDQYSSYSTPGGQHVAVPAQAVPPSFYGAGVVSAGQVSSGQQQQQQSQQRTAFPVPDLQSMGGPKDARRGGNSGSMESWAR